MFASRCGRTYTKVRQTADNHPTTMKPKHSLTSTQRLRVLFVRLEANALAVRSLLDESVEIVETRHAAAACTAPQGTNVDVIIVDEKLPSWDLHVIRERVERHDTIVMMDPRVRPEAIAHAIEALRPRKQTPTL